MVKHFRARPEHWEFQENWADKPVADEDSSCFLELRSRVEALEAAVGIEKSPTDAELLDMWAMSDVHDEGVSIAEFKGIVREALKRWGNL